MKTYDHVFSDDTMLEGTANIFDRCKGQMDHSINKPEESVPLGNADSHTLIKSN